MTENPTNHHSTNPTGGRPFLGIHFVKCGTYGRIYRNKEGTAYVGNCPRCMHHLRVRIGPEGTGTRFFKCFCP